MILATYLGKKKPSTTVDGMGSARLEPTCAIESRCSLARTWPAVYPDPVRELNRAVPCTRQRQDRYIFWMADVHELSQSAYDRLKAEHDDLTTRGRIDIARKIETARELGDLSENGDYHAAKEEQGKMAGRILHLASILENSEIVADGIGGGDIVRTGSIVSLLYEGDDEIERYLVGSIEEKRDDVMVVSPGSPMGIALLDARIGDDVEYDSPGGTIKVEIVAID